MYKIELSSAFEKAYLKLDAKTQVKIRQALKKLKEDYNSCDIKKLTSTEQWRLRVGNYRIIFEKRSETKEIIILLVLTIGHRKDIYR